VFDLFEREGLTTADVSAHVEPLKGRLLELVAAGRAGPLDQARLLNPPRGGASNARFLALRHPEAAAWSAALAAAGVIIDVRAEVLRIGLGLYHDPADVDRFAAACRERL
jgi:selenocysteine lyase/cysteine desulfurase